MKTTCKLQLITALVAILFISSFASAQVIVSDNNATTGNSSAVLDIISGSGDKGLLIPRVDIPSLLSAAPVSSPATGLLVYNTNGTTGPGFFYWNGSVWTALSGSVASETDPIFTAWDKDYDDITNKPTIINSQWVNTGSNIYFNGGNVGIGVNAPSALLHFYKDFGGNTASPFFLASDNVNALYMFPRLTTQAYNLGVQAGDFGIMMSQYKPLFIGVQDGEGIRISTNLITMGANGGNVGIGTTTPLYKLDVNGAINGTSVLVNGVPVASSTDTYWSTSGAGKIQYSGGNVGVGVASPSYALDVNGDINVTGSFKVNGAPLTGTGTVTNVTGNSPISVSNGTTTPVISINTVPVTKGGTGTDVTPTQGGVIYAASTSNYASTSSGTSGQVLTSNGTSAPSWTTIVATPTGAVQQFAGSTPPSGYLFCDGQAVSRTTYSELFSVIGTTYGSGDGSTTFNVPNLKGKIPVGKSTETEFDALGETGGEKTHTITTAQMPSHTHTFTGTSHTHTFSANSHTHTFTGGSHSHSIDDPGHRHRIYAAESGADGSYIDTDDTNSDAPIRSSLVSCATTTTGISINSASVSGTNSSTTVTGSNASTTAGGSNSSTGSGSPMNVIQPYIVLNYIIKY